MASTIMNVQPENSDSSQSALELLKPDPPLEHSELSFNTKDLILMGLDETLMELEISVLSWILDVLVKEKKFDLQIDLFVPIYLDYLDLLKTIFIEIIIRSISD